MTVTLTIIHTNDLHARYEQWGRQAAWVRRRKGELEAQGEPYLLLDTGDHMDFSFTECLGTGGRMHLRMLEELGYHTFAPGNNELFRNTAEQIRALSRDSNVPWLLSNVREPDGGLIGDCRGSLLIELSPELRVGLIGVTEQFDNIFEERHGLKNADNLQVIREGSATLRGQGANLIILQSHIGLETDREFARQLQGVIDVIVGAHSHSALATPEVIGNIPIVQAGCYGRYVGELRLEIDPAAGNVVRHEGGLHVIATEGPGDERQMSLFAEGCRDAEEFLSEVVTTLDRDYAHAEWVTLIAEAMRAEWNAEIGILLGATATAGMHAGEVTLGDISSVCRSLFSSCYLEMQGRQIAGVLQESLASQSYEKVVIGHAFRPGGPVGHMHMAGVTYGLTADGQVTDVRVNGEPLEENRIYTVAGCGHLREPELVNYPSLEGTKLLQVSSFDLVKDVLIRYLKSNQHVTV